MNRISIGHYLPRKSPIHSLDARVKLATLIILMFMSFTITTINQVLLSAIALLCLLKLTNIPLKTIFKSLKPVLIFMLVLSMFNMLVVHKGNAVLSLGFITVTDKGLITAGLYAYRFLVMVLTGAVLLLTTSPTQLTQGFESLLSPLKRFNAPISEISLTLSLALRFIPTLADEAYLIMQAQQARGASFENGSFADKLKAISANIMPMFANTMRHADSLGKALDARCWNSGSKRTSWHPMKISKYDFIFIAIALVYAFLLIYIKNI